MLLLSKEKKFLYQTEDFINIKTPYFIVNEAELCNKIYNNFPYIDLILDQTGELIDVTILEKPEIDESNL